MLAFLISPIPTRCRVQPSACTTHNGDQNAPPARKRGRPRGSRNKNRKASLNSDSSRATKGGAAGNGAGISQKARDAGNGAIVGNDARENDGGGYEASFAENFHLLLPFLTENKEEVESEETVALREFLDIIINRELSMYRRVAQDGNLRPFRARAAAAKDCTTCKGVGETKCRYCQGLGFLELDPNHQFNPEFEGWILEPPTHAVGDFYHCPLCGGRCVTRCEECAGTGLRDGLRLLLEGKSPVLGDEKIPFAATSGATVPATEPFDMDAFIDEHRDRIEWTPEGILILRAQRRRTRRRQPAKDKSHLPDAAPVRKRGRPRRRPDTTPVTDTSASARRKTSRRSTDFLNTTDFQVGRRLSSASDDTTDNNLHSEGDD